MNALLDAADFKVRSILEVLDFTLTPVGRRLIGDRPSGIPYISADGTEGTILLVFLRR